jgi:hypothetical protein
MRTLMIVVLLSVATCSQSDAQFRQGNVELSFSASLGSRSSKSSSPYYSSSESYDFMYLGVSPGIYLVRGLSFEPEIGVMALQKHFPAWYLLGNLSYTLDIQGTGVAPFARGGFGVSNAILPFPGTLIAPRISDKLRVHTVNIGAGAKTHIAGPLYFRSEFNYKRYHWTERYPNPDPGYPFTRAFDYADLALFFGFSVLI